jgi:zinc protease
MKNAFLSILTMIVTMVCYAQEFHEYTLANGLTVYLQEDNMQPNAVGAVIVKGGAKCDPADATGIAHYFEHMLFKGTDSIGTIDYVSEKVYLDSIKWQYDKLGQTTDDNERVKIQRKINQLSVKAADYAIPNELDRLVNHMGGTGLNAFTSEDNIVYFNTFPGDKTPLWLELYAHRFVNPVFRMFQSELETVYEEKNMYADDMFTAVMEKWQSVAYPNHPYGTQTILGSAEHLKNPSLSKMQAYFETYYVPNNMALAITGNFKIEEIKPIIERTFGAWEKKPAPTYKQFPEHAYKGAEKHTVRMTPVRVGAIMYKGVPSNHQDALKLEILSEILSNGAETGLLDELRSDKKVMMAQMMVDSKVDLGNISILYLPKIVGQSMGKAEQHVLGKIAQLKAGDFDERLLTIAKVEQKKSFNQYMENPSWKLFSLIEVFNNNQTWEEYLAEQANIDKITKADIVEVANKYFGDDYAILRSRTGFPKKDKIKKPDFEPIIPKNTEAESVYAQQFKAKDTIAITPLFMQLGEVGKDDIADKDVLRANWSDKVAYYHGNNPINTIFKISFQYGIGRNQEELIPYVCSHINEIGTAEKSHIEFNKEMQLLGASFYAYPTENYFTIQLEGLEEHFDETVALFSDFLNNLKSDDDKIKMLARDTKQERKIENKSAQDKIGYLFDYSRYGEKAIGVRRKTVKEIKKLSSQSLIDILHKGLQHEVNILYTGQRTPEEVKSTIAPSPLVKNVTKDGHFKDYIPYLKVEEPIVYYINDPKAVQSQIYIWTPGNALNEEKRLQSTVFNEYFGGGMEGIVFQEIREFRSLAYGCFGRYYLPNNPKASTMFLCGLSTQADKSEEAIDVFLFLLNDMPRKPERVENIKNGMIKSVNASRTSFRYAPASVANWEMMGYTEDPKIKALNYVENNFDFDEIISFYESEIDKTNTVMCIVGDIKTIGKDTLAKYGKVVELKTSDVMKF